MALTPDRELIDAAASITKAASRVAKLERDLDVERKRRGEIWRERNAAIERLRQASLAMAVALDTGRVDHNGHPDNEGEPDCGGCWWETVERIHKIIGGEQP